MPKNLKETIKTLCKLYGIFPSKSRGQNFLVDENVYKKIIQHAELTKDDIVLEVGPGFGFMTLMLAEKAKQVVAVELDKKLVEALHSQLIGVRNIKIVQGDILKIALSNGLRAQSSELRAHGYKIVANLPYNITSHFLRKFLTENQKPSLMVIMLQKEVAERICAKPGEMSLLSFSVQFYAEPKIIEYVPKENFWPKPEVDSAIIKIIPHKKEKIDFFLKKAEVDEKSLFRIVRWGFASRRKQIHNNIASGFFTILKRKVSLQELESVFQASKIHPQARAQELSLSDWLNLAQTIYKKFNF